MRAIRPVPIHMLDSKRHCDGMRSGAFERQGGHESSNMVTSALIKRPWRSLASCTLWGCGEKATVFEPGKYLSPDRKSASTLISSFQSPEL